MRLIYVRINPDRVKEVPDFGLDLPAKVVADGGGGRRLTGATVAGVDGDAILILRALKRRDILEAKAPAPAKE